ncbi:hypothetical protein GCM10007385_31990 [Tateyamaria omphalii]|nr:hypothetical protein GCM10007385_31990 [Tateyamaria omphalii]
MLLSTAACTVKGAFVKAASIVMPVGLILVLFGFGGALAGRNKETVFSVDLASKPMPNRVVFQIAGHSDLRSLY